MLDGLCYGMLG